MPLFDKKDKSRYDTFTRRAVGVGGAMAAVFAVLGGRLYQLQIKNGDEYLLDAEANRVSQRLLAPPRGRIMDRFGVELANNRRNYRVLLVSGDRESEVRYLAEKVGIHDIYASQSPEQKVEIVRRETKRASTIFVGDGINDAPALLAATVGIAFGQTSDVTTEAADVVIMDSKLAKVDEFLHISQRMRRIALQSAIGGMLASIIGMLFAAFGFLPPVAGAIVQEIIDVAAVANALRVAVRPKSLTDF